MYSQLDPHIKNVSPPSSLFVLLFYISPLGKLLNVLNSKRFISNYCQWTSTCIKESCLTMKLKIFVSWTFNIHILEFQLLLILNTWTTLISDFFLIFPISIHFTKTAYLQHQLTRKIHLDYYSNKSLYENAVMYSRYMRLSSDMRKQHYSKQFVR